MVLYLGVPTVACTLGNPSLPRWPVSVRSPSPRRPSLSTPTPLGRLTPNVPCARPTGTVWIRHSPITTSRKYYVTPQYVERSGAPDPYGGPVGKWFSFDTSCNLKKVLKVSLHGLV